MSTAGEQPKSMESILGAIFEKTKSVTGGKVADYIPQLANVNPELFGVAFCDKDGNLMGFGDCDQSFCFQSTVKPLNYCLARFQEQSDDDAPIVHNHVGFEPSGVKFNAFVLNDNGLPHNPLINSGAIMVSSLIGQKYEPSERFQLVQHFIGKLSGMGESAIGFDNGVYLSEKVHADRNISLAYYMRENRAYAGHPTQSELSDHLDLYFQTCSLTCTCKTMASIAATLAFNGRSPVSGENVVQPEIVMDCLSIMFMCGMYDFSGQFAFHNGLPCKSGVSGAIMLVIPNVGGLCIWSPPLDNLGNSVRGLAFCNELTLQTNSALHIFRSMQFAESDDDISGIRTLETLTMRLIHACATGSMEQFKKLIDYGHNKFRESGESSQDAIKRILEIGDYDKRSCLHLAAAECNVEIVEFLISQGVEQYQDRWGVTPMHEVRKHLQGLKPTADAITIAKYRSIVQMLSGRVFDDESFASFIKKGHEESIVAPKYLPDASTHSMDRSRTTHGKSVHVGIPYSQKQEPIEVAHATAYEGSPVPNLLQKVPVDRNPISVIPILRQN